MPLLSPDDLEGYDYILTILGNPKAQGRPRAAKKGRFVSVYEDEKDTLAKHDLAVVVQQEAPEKLIDCAVRVDIHFYFPRPKSHFGTGRNAGILKPSSPLFHTSKPDRDNLDKLVLDALTGVFWVDDKVVCQGWLQKEYSDKPRIEIFIRILE